MSRRVAYALAPMLLLLAIGRPATAFTDAMELVQPRADRSDFQMLLEGTELDRDTRSVVEMIFRTYVADLSGIAGRVAAAADAAGRREVDEAMAGRRRIDPAELRRMRAEVRRAELEAWTPAAALIDDLLLNIQVMVAIDDEAFETQARRFRRSVLLAPRQAYAADSGYAGDGVDLIELLEEAVLAGDLAAFDPESIRGLLDTYARRVDALSARIAEEIWRARLLAAIARIERDERGVEDAERAYLDAWREHWLLNTEFATQIGAEIEARAGSVARLRWDDRYEQACFPWLFAASRPERQFRWISGNRLVAADVVRRAEDLIQDHRAEYRELAREAIDIVLRGRLELGLLLSPRTDSSTLRDARAQGMLRDLLQNSGRRSHREDRTAQALEGLLPDNLRAQMRSDLAAASFGRRR